MRTPMIIFRSAHEPTPAQAKAGNYKKKKIDFAGFPVSIENPAGSVRCGVDPDGNAWETRMLYDYGYIRGTLGVDGDHVDCYLGPDESAPVVYIVTTMTPGQWRKADEQKAMIGFASEEDAQHAFLAHFDDPRFLGPVTAMPVEEFRAKLRCTRENPQMIKALFFKKSLVTQRVQVKGTVRKDGVVIPPHTRTQKVHVGDDLDHQSENYRYRDTGYVPGSRKERAAEMIRRASRAGQQVRVRDIDWDELEANAREAKQIITKGNLFGNVDWPALRDAGIDPGSAFLVGKLYSAVATEPVTDSPEARRDYSVGLESLRTRMEACRSVDDVAKTIAEIRDEASGAMLNEAQQARYAELRVVYDEKKAVYAAFKLKADAAYKELRNTEGEYYKTQGEIDKRTRRGWQVPAEMRENLAGIEKERQEKHAAWRAAMGLDAGDDSEYKVAEREARAAWKSLADYTDQAKKENLENQATRSWRQLGDGFLKAVNYRSYSGSKAFANHVATVRAGRVSDWAWLDKKAAPRKVTKTSADFQLKVAEEIERRGGRNIAVDSTASLKEHFNLRDVQSGNWVLKDINSAKFHVERCAEAFADLADLTGIPDEQISFHGRLAMAFGARGRGGKNAAMAHYESVHRVINMTKMSGAGSLAHEWFHMVDNVLVEADGGGAKDADFYFSENIESIRTPEIKAAALGLMVAMTHGQHRLTEVLEYTDDEVVWAKRNVEGYGTGVRTAIREAGGAQAAADAVDAAYENRHFGDPKSRKAQKLRNDWKKIALIYHGQSESKRIEYKTGKGVSQFAADAYALDSGRSKPYWSQVREMAARAFEAYIEDKLHDADRENTYLVANANNDIYAVEGARPYPDGEERKRINTAFDRLFSVLRRDGTLAKALLLKGGDGSGWFAPPKGSHIPSSDGVSSLEEAQAYWKEHFADKTLRLGVHTKSRGVMEIEVFFPKENDHAYTEDEGRAKSGKKNGQRVFDANRARLMGRILPTIQHPAAILMDGSKNLHIERADGESHHIVVLNWNESGNRYVFSSAHDRTTKEVQNLKRSLRPTLPKTTLRKSKAPVLKKSLGASSAFQVFDHSSALKPSNGWSGAVTSDPLPIPSGSSHRVLGVHTVAETMFMFKSRWNVDGIGAELCCGSGADRLVLLRGESATEGEGTYFLWHSDDPIAQHLLKAVPAGSKWITVHPNDAGKGVPVLVQETKKGSGVWHVIGGAGGKLNYLKLHGLGEGKDYKQDLAERQKRRRDEKKAQVEQDKAAGVYESKQAARKDIATQRKTHERKYIETVASAMGWDDKTTQFDEEKHADLSDKARDKLRDKHHAELLKKAHDAVNLQRTRLAADADARMAARLGELPLQVDDPETLSVADLAPVKRDSAGLGFSPNYGERAGLDTAALKNKAEAIKPLTDEARLAALKRGEAAQLIRKELENIREPLVPEAAAKLVDAAKAADLLRAQKQLQMIREKAREAGRDLDRAPEAKSYNLHVSAADVSERIRKEAEDDLNTARTSAFLREAGKASEQQEETLGKHLGVGAYNSLNSLSLTATGGSLLDRSVVDVLGIAGAAQVLARRLHTDMPEEIKNIADGMEDFHTNHYPEVSAAALEEAQKLSEVAGKIDLGAAVDGHDLAAAQELNAKRREAVQGAQKILGQALGEMEANAALVMALKAKPEKLEVPLGNASLKSAIQQAHAIGLDDGDYRIDSIGGTPVLTVSGTGMDKLAAPVAREDSERLRRNLDIIEGKQDEADWLPLGFARRPDLALDVKPGVAESFAVPFEPGDDLEQSLRDYIGARAADGEPPADIMADVQSADFFRKVGAERMDDYRAALDRVAPLRDEKGKMQRAETLAEAFDTYADDFVARRGGELSTLNRQKFTIDQKTADALHRALADTPEGSAAYKPIGELTGADQRALREFFYRNIAKESSEAAQLRAELESHAAAEPEKETVDMFGEAAVNPDWQDWRARRDELSGRVKSGSLGWADYIKAVGGNVRAYESMQDLIRSRVAEKFAETHNKLNRGSPLKLGKMVIRNNLDHLDAVDPEAREARMAEERALQDSLRNRIAGRYAAGGIADKISAAREQQAAFDQAQMGFFSSEEVPADKASALKSDERYTLGHAAERQIASMMPAISQNFRAGQKIKFWQPTMSGGKNAPRQRLLKFLEANKRIMCAFGTGSGKSALQLGGFTHLHEKGKVKKGVIIAPSIVVGQFGGEALRYLEPGKYRWHAQPGASRDERIAAYRDPENHFSVVTHQSFRDDMIHLGAKHAGVTETEMADRLQGMDDDARAAWAKSVMDKEGFKFDYIATDESQYTLNREGKENSRLANVVDAFAEHADYYMPASGDPAKNDASEVYDIMRKMDRNRYSDRAAFMRKYGVDTLAAKEALRREMLRHVYPSKIDPDVRADKKVVKVSLSESQKKALADLDRHVAEVRLQKLGGKVAVESLKRISPSSFEGVPVADHEKVAAALSKSVGIIKNAAVNRIITADPDGAKLAAAEKIATERKGKPGIIFARNLDVVEAAKKKLEAAGHRVVTITGADSAAEKDRKRLMFHPESGEAQADILIASDAAATGLNLQRGQWMAQVDTPMTAMVHAQRSGRIFRTGQKNDVELIDVQADHVEERRARTRLMRKYGLRELMTSPFEGLDDTGLGYFLKQRQAERVAA